VVEVLALKPGSDFDPRDVRIFQPYRDEIPWELLGEGDTMDHAVADGERMRVAKFSDEVIGVYVIVPQGPLSYRLELLVVADAFRRRGVGRWLLGHAIGLAESKGGRELVVSTRGNVRLFVAAGFETHRAAELRLLFTPE
jgi:GNAT superfamily N-acetyltransferase